MSIDIMDVLTFYNLLLSAIGSVAGIILGFLPGISGTMAIAIILPFTFGMDPIPAFSLLLGVYSGIMYGGSITAVLIRTPGKPAAVVTTLDGYPMAQQGRAIEALTASCWASFFGGAIGFVVLFLSAQPIARFALRFGPAEYFAVGLFGLSVVTLLSTDNVKKGVIGGCLGFMMSTIGMDPVGGLVRYTWGSRSMMAGLEIVPVIIGIFAITEVLSKLDNSRHKPVSEMQNLKGKSVSFKTLWRNKYNIIRSSLIGVIFGIIPGVGGGSGAWVSYTTTMKLSKEPESFGKGQVDGLIASEASNNGDIGGSLLPTLTLGVPGDAIAAVMLGALTLQGLNPGPMLFTQHGDVVRGIYVMLVTGNFFVLIFGLILIRLCVMILKMPERSLMTAVLLLCMVGSFAIRSNPFDVLAAVVIGILGHFFLKAGFPIPPVIIGFVLGNLVEANFRRALVLSEGNGWTFFTRPISLAFLIVSIVLFFGPIVYKLITGRQVNLGSDD